MDDLLSSEEKKRVVRVKRDREAGRLAMLTMFVLGISVGIVLAVALKTIEKRVALRAAMYACTTCHNIENQPPIRRMTYSEYQQFNKNLIR